VKPESKSEKSDLYNAARNGLGLLGVVSTVTLQCEDAFNLEKLVQPASVEEAVDVDSKLSSNQYYAIWWFPHVNKVILSIMNKTKQQAETAAPEANKAAQLKKQAMAIAISFALRFFSKFIIGITAFIELFTTTFLGIYYSTFQRTTTIQKSYEALFENYASILPRWSAVEYFVPVDSTASVLKDVTAAIKGGGWKINFPARITFVKGDDSWLSEAYDRDSACFAIAMYQKASQWKQFVKKIDTIMKKYEGRPHWAKYHQLTRRDFETMYPKWNDFLDIRRRYDPQGIFLNDYLEPLFG